MTDVPPRRYVSDRAAIVLAAAWFASRQVTTRVAIPLIPALSKSAPWTLPLLRNTGTTVIVAAAAAYPSLAGLAGVGFASLSISMIVGAILYWVGSRFGVQLAERGARTGSTWSSIWNPKRVARAHRWLERWGVVAVAASRIWGALNVAVCLVSGSSRMTVAKYAIAQLIGSALWAASAVGLGIQAARVWPWLPDRIQELSAWSLRIGLASLVLLVIALPLAGRAQRSSAPEPSDPEAS